MAAIKKKVFRLSWRVRYLVRTSRNFRAFIYFRSSCSDMPLSNPTTYTNFDDDEDTSFVTGTVPGSKGVFRQKRLQTEPSDLSHLDTIGYGQGPSPISSPKSPLTFDPNDPVAHSTLQVPPKSPKTPRQMGHLIPHRFAKTFKPGKCNYCQDYMFNGTFKR